MLNEIRNFEAVSCVPLTSSYSLPTSAVDSELRSLRDAELLSRTKSLVERERELTALVIRHLEEIERRKLYADLHYPSLFAYATMELKYSSSAAGRRIDAMRLVKEIPEVEAKIESGVLTLSHISQAQTYFRDIKRAEPERALLADEKLAVLAQLENKSSREAERVLLSITPPSVLPRERERAVSAEHTEVKFLIDNDLKAKLEEVRSLLGPKGAQMSLAELVAEMAKLSSERLQEKRFGKKRVTVDHAKESVGQGSETAPGYTMATHGSVDTTAELAPDAGSESARRTRYIPQAVKHTAWKRAGGQCVKCGSKRHLQFDHVKPFALGGESTPKNIQLLCASCNLRRGVKAFGPAAMRRA